MRPLAYSWLWSSPFNPESSSTVGILWEHLQTVCDQTSCAWSMSDPGTCLHPSSPELTILHSKETSNQTCNPSTLMRGDTRCTRGYAYITPVLQWSRHLCFSYPHFALSLWEISCPFHTACLWTWHRPQRLGHQHRYREQGTSTM